MPNQGSDVSEGGSMHVRSGAVVLFLFVLLACGPGASVPATPFVPSSQAVLPTAMTSSISPSGSGLAARPTAKPTTIGTAAPPSLAIDLSGVEACTLLDEAGVRALTGTSLEFVTDSRDNTHCFWGATTPGDPQYVEIDVFSRPTGLSGYSFSPGSGCTTVAVSGVGAEAQGGTCTDPQFKVYVLAWQAGVAVSVLVNEPTGGLAPGDLAGSVATMLEELQAT
jgi:hypothetical protein